MLDAPIRRAAGTFLLAVCGACGEVFSAADGCVELAVGAGPPVAGPTEWTVWDGGRFRWRVPSPETDGTTGAFELRPRSWRDHGGGLWSTPHPFPGLLGRAREATVRAGTPAASTAVQRCAKQLSGALRHLDGGLATWDLPSTQNMLERGFERSRRPSHYLGSRRLYLLRDAGAGPPQEILLRASLDLGSAAEGRWRLPLGDVVADALPVLPGTRLVRTVHDAGGGVLTFQSAAVGTAPGDGEAELTFRVHYDGELVHEHTQEPGVRPPFPFHRVSLPRRPLRGELSFSVEGPAALTAFVQPLLRPASLAVPPLPDVVVLLADTFRADNLAAWGGDGGCDDLDAFAARGLRFLEARTPGAWTLPAHASLFTSMYPGQCGILISDDRLAPAAPTLAEAFDAAGYRTVAVTDQGFVSRLFGLDQGFEWFEEERDHELEPTLESLRALLAADDGRPLFLFVQSYHSHEYDAPRDGDAPRLTPDFERVLRRSDRGRPARDPKGVCAALEEQYRARCRGTDDGFGALLALLAEHGADQGIVVFTSDHGEAFGEHGIGGHGTGVWDEIARVPLVLRAPGLAPGDERRPVSLIDLAPTLTRLAGVRGAADWLGRDLLDPGRGQADVLMFQTHEEEEAALLHERTKLIFQASGGVGALSRAYRLDRDPGEQHDLSREPAVRALWQGLRDGAASALAPVLSAERAVLGQDTVENLRALGYLGEDGEAGGGDDGR